MFTALLLISDGVDPLFTTQDVDVDFPVDNGGVPPATVEKAKPVRYEPRQVNVTGFSLEVSSATSVRRV